MKHKLYDARPLYLVDIRPGESTSQRVQWCVRCGEGIRPEEVDTPCDGKRGKDLAPCKECYSIEVVFEASHNMGFYCYNCGVKLQEKCPWVKLHWLKAAKVVFPPQILGAIKQLTGIRG